MLAWKSSVLNSSELNEFGEIFIIKNNKIVSPLTPSAVKSALQTDFYIMSGHCDVDALSTMSYDIWNALINKNHLPKSSQDKQILDNDIDFVRESYKGLVETINIFEKDTHINLASINPKKLSDETSDDSCLVSNYLNALVDKRILTLLNKFAKVY